MDAKLVRQIAPLIRYAEINVPDLKFEDKEKLTAELYLGMATFLRDTIPPFLARLDRLEALKTKGKEQKFLDNIQSQQDTILAESKEKQNIVLNKIYTKWYEGLDAIL